MAAESPRCVIPTIGEDCPWFVPLVSGVAALVVVVCGSCVGVSMCVSYVKRKNRASMLAMNADGYTRPSEPVVYADPEAARVHSYPDMEEGSEPGISLQDVQDSIQLKHDRSSRPPPPDVPEEAAPPPRRAPPPPQSRAQAAAAEVGDGNGQEKRRTSSKTEKKEVEVVVEPAGGQAAAGAADVESLHPERKRPEPKGAAAMASQGSVIAAHDEHGGDANSIRNEHKAIKKKLREYEIEFEAQHGRKPKKKKDWQPVIVEYERYAVLREAEQMAKGGGA